jgi:hypothetical protein
LVYRITRYAIKYLVNIFLLFDMKWNSPLMYEWNRYFVIYTWLVTHIDFEDIGFSQRIKTASLYIDSNVFHRRGMFVLFLMFILVTRPWQLIQSTITQHFIVGVLYSILKIQCGIFWPSFWSIKCISHWFWCCRYKKLTLLLSASYSTCLISLWQSLLCKN